MSATNIVSLAVSLGAILIAAASLWRSSLKPAALEVEYLNVHVGRGGVNGIPSIAKPVLFFALANLGARSGLLHSFELKAVRALGAPDVATGPRELEVFDGSGGPLNFPRTVEPGDVRSWRVNSKLAGSFSTAQGTTPTPDPKPLAQQVGQLAGIELTFTWRYRRSRLLRAGTEEATGSLRVEVPGKLFREAAAATWADQGNDRLAEMARCSGEN